MKRILILFICVACGTSQNEALNKQSFELHEAALQSGKLLKEKIEKLEADVGGDSTLIDSLATLRQSYLDWEESIVEVPGHEHAHHDHDHEGHDHDHSASPDLTPEMVLEVQTALRQRAEQLNVRADILLEQLKK